VNAPSCSFVIKEFAMRVRLSLALLPTVFLLAACQPPPATTVTTVDPGTGTSTAVTTTPGAPAVAVTPGTGTTVVNP
jgi:hypothetical protein